MNFRTIVLQLKTLIPDTFPLVLLSSKAWKAYSNGKPTDTILGQQYEILAKGGNYERFWVKIAGTDNVITNDEILAEKKELIVKLTNAVCTPYVNANHQIEISVKADKIELI